MNLTEPRVALEQLYSDAVRAVDPAALVARHVRREGSAVAIRFDRDDAEHWPLPLHVVAAGKPAARMAAGCVAALGPDAVRGIAVTADGCAETVDGFVVFEAGHPLPDARGQAATQALVEAAQAAPNGLLCLLGGGASSLLVAPREPLTLADDIAVTRLLLACGAEIHEFNAVRKHLSSVKGGGLLRFARGEVVTLTISDVVGNDAATIGSGPTVPDGSTYADALGVLARYELRQRVPPAVLALLEAGARGDLPETVKPGTPEAARSRSHIIGDNRLALTTAAAAARARGWDVVLAAEEIRGDAFAAARRFAGMLRANRLPHRCLIAGGETTVVVRGSGRGGRNQEFALALVEELAGTGWTVLSAGTDGIDGPTAAAGAFVNGASLERARAAGLDPAVALADNDSNGFFAALGDLFTPGPTGTNVMDIVMAVHPENPMGA